MSPSVMNVVGWEEIISGICGLIVILCIVTGTANFIIWVVKYFERIEERLDKLERSVNRGAE
jgi:hypothetical protein